MIVIARPSGGGKSSIFPLAKLATKHFNADDRATELNGGSYLRIPTHIRETASREFEAFVSGRVSQRESFAIETTLRSPVTFDQAQNARAAGFIVEMRYLALNSFAMHWERINNEPMPVAIALQSERSAESTTSALRISRGPLQKQTNCGSMTIRSLPALRRYCWKALKAQSVSPQMIHQPG